MSLRSRIAQFLDPIGQAVENKPAVFLLVFVTVFVPFYGIKLDHRGVGGGDEVDFLRGAYHLVHNNTFSETPNRDIPVPGVRRAPGYAFFLSLGIRITPSLRDHDFECVFDFKKGVAQEPKALVYLKYMQAFLLLLTALMIGWIVLDSTGRLVPAYFALWLVGFHPFLERYVNRLYAEILGAFLMTLLTVLLYLGLKRKNILSLVIGGFVLGCMTLTFSQWKLVAFVTIPSVALCVLLMREKVGRMLLGVALMAVMWFAVFHPWELRNKELTGRQFLSSGGGAVLHTRALYDLMPWGAYWSSFAYWSRSPLFKKSLIAFVDKDMYVALLRDAPEGVYRTSKKRRAEIIRESGVSGEYAAVEWDRLAIEDALGIIKAHPVRHLLTSLPIAFRSMMNPMFSILYIYVYYLFIMGVWRSIVNREWVLATLFASPLALFGFNVLVTHGLPRYSEQAAPLLMLGAVVGYCLKSRTPKSTLY